MLTASLLALTWHLPAQQTSIGLRCSTTLLLESVSEKTIHSKCPFAFSHDCAKAFFEQE
jgi:hypothetical protein